VCRPRTLESTTEKTPAYDQLQKAPLSTKPLMNIPPQIESAVHGDSRSSRITTDSMLSELIQQIPSFTGNEALPLSTMIADQLRRWDQDSILTFRRTKIIEKCSRASVTIVDFECASPSSDQRRAYTSSIVMSDIIDPDRPESQVSCLWAPAYDGKSGTTFTREADHILSVLKQGWEGGKDSNERLRTSVAAMAINYLYTHHFSCWSPLYGSPEAAIQRACAWGIVASKSRQLEYRLFAASLSCFLNSQINITLQTSDFDSSVPENRNDLRFFLVPYFRVFDIDLGMCLDRCG
jgi:hypothetical protein